MRKLEVFSGNFRTSRKLIEFCPTLVQPGAGKAQLILWMAPVFASPVQRKHGTLAPVITIRAVYYSLDELNVLDGENRSFELGAEGTCVPPLSWRGNTRVSGVSRSAAVLLTHATICVPFSTAHARGQGSQTRGADTQRYSWYIHIQFGVF